MRARSSHRAQFLLVLSKEGFPAWLLGVLIHAKQRHPSFEHKVVHLFNSNRNVATLVDQVPSLVVVARAKEPTGFNIGLHFVPPGLPQLQVLLVALFALELDDIVHPIEE